MCGICGIYDHRGPTRARLERMASALRHRGPDDEGYLIDGPLGFGHRRLSIIDLDGGRQPIANEDESVWIVYNGEIYNFQELRGQLLAQGHRFRTNTDTETILHLYEEMGERCVDRLRGMFAFAIWDARQGKLFLARDRLGQKPLFYLHRGGELLFSSEIKGILADPSVERRLDASALHGYLALRFVPSPLTMFEGIRSLPPAHTLTLQDGRLETRRYWDLSYQPKLSGGDEELTDRLEELLRDAVRSHLVSDVPVGTFLSGGIDSGLMTALTAEVSGGTFPTFSIGSKEESFNELPVARLVADHFGTEHHEEVVDPDIVSFLPEMVHHLDMPGDPIAACQYYVAKLAGRHVKVSIGGDGGDELFGGYDRFAGFKWIGYYATLPRIVRDRLIGPVLSSLPDSFAYKSTVSKLRWLQELSFHDEAERYAEATAYFRFNQERMERLYGDRMAADLLATDPRLPLIEAFEGVDASDVLDRMLHVDTTTRLPEHLLILNDRMTMAQSLEGRSPMLDHQVAEFAASLPTDMKLRGRKLKYILRAVARRHLPPEMTNLPKQGFMFPIAKWLKTDLRDASRTLLLDSRMVEEGYFRKDGLTHLLDEHQSGQVDHHHRLWMVLNLEVWFRLYLDGEGISALTRQMEAVTSASVGGREAHRIENRIQEQIQ